jgi:putative transposase
MVNKKEEEMHERTINSPRKRETKEICPPTEAANSEGMGRDRKRHRGCPKVSNPSPNPLSLEESLGTGRSDLSGGKEASHRSSDPQAGEGESKPERGLGSADPRVHAFKKRDELGLANRSKGSSYSLEQRQRIIEEVQKLQETDLSKTEILKAIGVARSTYYGWSQGRKVSSRVLSPTHLTTLEKEAVVEKKKQEPQLSHRQISGSLRLEEYWVSPSSCYRVLKSRGWVSMATLREAPWKVPRYEPFRSNQIWGEDWTILSIDHARHYLLTLIDYFSRYVVAWGVVRAVTQVEVQNLLVLAYLSEGIEARNSKPILRVDRGSPNMAANTKRLIRDLEMVLSPSRAYRPTDNSRQERWYRTVKQEEIYCYPTYPSLEGARASLARYIHFYNEERPHQALWNYPPGYVHRLGNKTLLLREYRERVKIVKEQRLITHRLLKENNFCQISN